jgi:hypothetical protein
MTNAVRFTILLSFVGVIGIPTLTFVVRATIKWTRVEDRLEVISNKLIDIVKDKDETHQEMLRQMREDREATNRRLRWLEENIWNARNPRPERLYRPASDLTGFAVVAGVDS